MVLAVRGRRPRPREGQIRAAIDRALAGKGQPCFIRARTHIGQGAPHKHDTKEAHGEALGADEVAATKRAMGFDPAKSFFVPTDVYTLSSKSGRPIWFRGDFGREIGGDVDDARFEGLRQLGDFVAEGRGFRNR